MTTYASINDLPPQHREQAAEQMSARRPSSVPGKRAVPVVLMGQPVVNGSHLEQTMSGVISTALSQFPDMPQPETEHRFHSKRRWRFDFAWPGLMLAVEVEGGQWVNGRHQRGQGFEDDCVKYNAAALAGWRVLRFTGDMVKDGRALATVLEALK